MPGMSLKNLAGYISFALNHKPRKHHKEEQVCLSAPKLQMWSFPDSVSCDSTLEEKEDKKAIWLMLAAPRSQAGCPARCLTASFYCNIVPWLQFAQLREGSRNKITLQLCCVWMPDLLQSQLVTTMFKNSSKYSSPVLEFSGTILLLKLNVCVSARLYL